MRPHGTLGDDLLNTEGSTTIDQTQTVTAQWLKRYNQMRPHQAPQHVHQSHGLDFKMVHTDEDGQSTEVMLLDDVTPQPVSPLWLSLRPGPVSRRSCTP